MRRQNLTTDFEWLFRTLRGELLAFYRKRLPDPQQAEDFVQRTFERLLAKSEIKNPEALAYEVATGLVKNSYRDEPAETISYEWLIGDGTGLDHFPQFQTYDFEDSTFAADFDRAVRVLDPPTRDAFIVGELRGLPSREAGAILGVSHETARTRRELATATIREEIA